MFSFFSLCLLNFFHELGNKNFIDFADGMDEVNLSDYFALAHASAAAIRPKTIAAPNWEPTI